MIKEEYICIKGHPRNLKYYISLGYDIKIGEECLVDSKHLTRGSIVKITSICDNCQKETLNVFKDYWNYTNGLKNPYYCNSCKTIKSNKTNLEKWGVENPMRNDVVKEKLKKSLIDKYGVDHYSKTEDYKNKYKKTCNDKWGVDNAFMNDDIKDKIKQTNLDKYGVDHHLKNDDILNKQVETCIKKYGVNHYSETDECKDKVKQTSQEKWGVDNYSQTDEYKKRVNDTNFLLWGGHPSKNEEFKSRCKNTKERNTYKKYCDLISEKYDVISYKNEIFEIVHKECKNKIQINKGLLISRLNLNKTICTVCNPIGVYYSEFESEVSHFLDSLEIEYERKNKTILKGKEIDIYIPQFKLAIECNGIYWHSELFKSEKYHINKTLSCNEAGMHLLHIWEDDWEDKREIVKSIIRSKLNLNNDKIFARKCQIRKVTTSEYKKFLNENHIQGYASSSYNIGLYYNNVLVSLMTFGWRRTNNKREFELIRFCNKLNTSVIGSASKLFSYFNKNINDDCDIISYADISLFEGGVYKILGFKKSNLSEPNYFWVVNKKRRHRYNFSKRKLVKLGFDPNKTEIEIMHSRGYYRIFSTGQEKWIYDKKNFKI